MKLAILGAGAWGTALALCFSHRKDIDITLVTVIPEHLEELETFRENTMFFPGFPLPESIKFSMDIPPNCDVVFSVGPAQEIETIASRLSHDTDPAVPIVFCSKGIFYKDHKGYLMTQLAHSYLKNPLLVLSGPNLAKEVAMNVPSATTLAGDDIELTIHLAKKLQHATMKIQASDDPLGAQVVGSMKNIFAIASGVFKGYAHLGLNAQSAFYVQCLQEMKQVMALYGGKSETLQSLAGIGDLVLTCSSTDSRNTSLGLALANGESYQSYCQRKHATTEGAYTVDVIHKIKGRLSLPICDFVYDMIHRQVDVKTAIEKLIFDPAYLV